MKSDKRVNIGIGYDMFMFLINDVTLTDFNFLELKLEQLSNSDEEMWEVVKSFYNVLVVRNLNFELIFNKDYPISVFDRISSYLFFLVVKKWYIPSDL